MAERRIRVPKLDVVKKLYYDEKENTLGIFKTYAEMMSFAATLGYKLNRHKPFEGTLIDPIRFSVFENSESGKLFYLLAFAYLKEAECLGNDEESFNARIEIFENFANGGLEHLEQLLKGKDDPFDMFILLLNKQREVVKELKRESVAVEL